MTTQRPVWLNAGALLLIACCGLAGAGCAPAADARATDAAGGRSSAQATGAPGRGAANAVTGRDPADSLTSRMDQARILGSPSARVWLVMVSDFQCPYCKQFHDETFDALRREYVETGKVRMAFVNFPLPMHANAWPAAEAAMCVGLQGKFWPFQDALFASQRTWADRHPASPAIDSIAHTLGIDTAALDRCAASPEVKSLIQADQDRAERAGVNATPTIIIGQTLIPGAQPIATYRHALDSTLAAGK